MSRKHKPKYYDVRKFTKAQVERCLTELNDVAEGIDCNRSRETLRMTIAYASYINTQASLWNWAVGDPIGWMRLQIVMMTYKIEGKRMPYKEIEAFVQQQIDDADKAQASIRKQLTIPPTDK